MCLAYEGVSGICGCVWHVGVTFKCLAGLKELTYGLRCVLIEVVGTIMLAVRVLHRFLHTAAGDDPIYCNNNIECHMKVM